FLGGARTQAFGFSIGNKGYIGGGEGLSAYPYDDLWEWDQATNTWSLKGHFPTGRTEAVGFSIGSKGYIGSGQDNSYNDLNDFYEWDQHSGILTQIASLGVGRFGAVGFSIGNSKAYIGTGTTASSGDV